MIKYHFFVVLLGITFNSVSQADSTFLKYAIEISSDNDAFSPSRNFDRYYTYGAGIKFYWRPNKFLGLERLFSKKLNVFFSTGMRSEGYTPTRIEFSELEPDEIIVNIDRPFAGLLYGTFDATYLFEGFYLRPEIIVGIMGPSAYSKEIQDWIHDNITDDDLIDGWYLQMPNQLILNLNISGAYNVDLGPEWFDLFAMGQARLGNLYIDATPTIGFRVGKFAALETSPAFNNALIANRSITEFYLRSSFSVTVAAYDGTAQGNILNNDFPYAVDNINNVFTSMSHGIFVTLNRFAVSYDNIFTFGQVNKDICHVHGRFSLLYRF